MTGFLGKRCGLPSPALHPISRRSRSSSGGWEKQGVALPRPVRMYLSYLKKREAHFSETLLSNRVQAPALIFIDAVPLTSALICTCADDGPATQTGTSAIPLHGPCFDRPYVPLQASSLPCGSTVLCLHP